MGAKRHSSPSSFESFLIGASSSCVMGAAPSSRLMVRCASANCESSLARMMRHRTVLFAALRANNPLPNVDCSLAAASTMSGTPMACFMRDMNHSEPPGGAFCILSPARTTTMPPNIKSGRPVRSLRRWSMMP